MEKLKRQPTVKEYVGKLLLDYSKLVFGGIVLGSIIRGEYPQAVLVVGGFIFAIVFCLIGLLFIKEDLHTEKTKTMWRRKK